MNLMPVTAYDAVKKTLDTLWTCLTPDGLLTGVAQSNRGGEKLQRGSYRVLSQMGMGLMAQLDAAVHRGRPNRHQGAHPPQIVKD